MFPLMIMNEIFGEGNFAATVIWQRIFSPKNSAKHFSEDHDFMLVYAKGLAQWTPNTLERSAAAISRYKNPERRPPRRVVVERPDGPELLQGTSKNVSLAVKGDRLGKSRPVSEDVASAWQGILPPDNRIPSCKEDDRDTRPHRWRSTHPRQTLQVNQAPHVVSEILQTYACCRPYQPDAANQQPAPDLIRGPAHVVLLRPKDMLYPRPKP